MCLFHNYIYFLKYLNYAFFIALVAVDDVLFVRQLYLMFMNNGRLAVVAVLEVSLVPFKTWQPIEKTMSLFKN